MGSTPMNFTSYISRILTSHTSQNSVRLTVTRLVPRYHRYYLRYWLVDWRQFRTGAWSDQHEQVVLTSTHGQTINVQHLPVVRREILSSLCDGWLQISVAWNGAQQQRMSSRRHKTIQSVTCTFWMARQGSVLQYHIVRRCNVSGASHVYWSSRHLVVKICRLSHTPWSGDMADNTLAQTGKEGDISEGLMRNCPVVAELRGMTDFWENWSESNPYRSDGATEIIVSSLLQVVGRLDRQYMTIN